MVYFSLQNFKQTQYISNFNNLFSNLPSRHNDKKDATHLRVANSGHIAGTNNHIIFKNIPLYEILWLLQTLAARLPKIPQQLDALSKKRINKECHDIKTTCKPNDPSLVNTTYFGLRICMVPLVRELMVLTDIIKSNAQLKEGLTNMRII